MVALEDELAGVAASAAGSGVCGVGTAEHASLEPAGTSSVGSKRRSGTSLGSQYHAVSVAVAEVRGRVVRASSVIENLNSRLRGYFFLRRHLGSDYLALLQFFLNHRRFLRSEHAERVGKSPAELLTGAAHGHWLELLGFCRFLRN